MKKIVLTLMAVIAIGATAQSIDLKFTTHYSQSHELYDAGMFVSKSETEIGSMGCDVMDIDNSFEFDGKTLIMDGGDEIYDITEMRVDEGNVFKNKGTHKTYILTAKNRSDESDDNGSDLITIAIVKDGNGKQNIIVTMVKRRFTGEVYWIETYSQLRE